MDRFVNYSVVKFVDNTKFHPLSDEAESSSGLKTNKLKSKVKMLHELQNICEIVHICRNNVYINFHMNDFELSITNAERYLQIKITPNTSFRLYMKTCARETKSYAGIHESFLWK